MSPGASLVAVKCLGLFAAVLNFISKFVSRAPSEQCVKISLKSSRNAKSGNIKANIKIEAPRDTACRVAIESDTGSICSCEVLNLNGMSASSRPDMQPGLLSTVRQNRTD